jgi:hypothetical protein
MKLSTGGKVLLAGAASAAVAVGAMRCSNRSKTARENGGTLALQLGSGASMEAPRWRVQNPALSIDQSGVVDVSKGQTAEQALEGLPAGNGYTITVESTTKGPHPVDCSAQGSFAIAAKSTSPLSVNLVCGVRSADGGMGGAVLLNGETPLPASCAAVTALSASPMETALGGSIALAARGVDGAGGGGGVRFVWTVTGGIGGGSFDSSTSSSPRFTCASPGLLTVTVRAATGGGGKCTNDTASVQLVCDNSDTGNGSGFGSGPSAQSGSTDNSNNNQGSSSGCVPNCGGKLCGDDGCGGSCGACGPGGACDDGGACVDPCPLQNAGAPCTPTEELTLRKSADCYTCLVDNGCLDDARLIDTGHECGDLVGTATRGAKTGTARSTLCLAVLECILSSNCATDDVEVCYCGSLGPAIGCSTGKSGADGPCMPEEVDALEHVWTDPPNEVIRSFFNLNLGAGMANQILACASSNHCERCLR